jgi:hypothetical protein
VLALVMGALYGAILVSEGDDELAAVLPFVVLIGGAGVAAVAGSLLRDAKLRASLLWPAAVVLTGVGVLAILSIGLPLLVAGVLSAVAAVRRPRR